MSCGLWAAIGMGRGFFKWVFISLFSFFHVVFFLCCESRCDLFFSVLFSFLFLFVLLSSTVEFLTICMYSCVSLPLLSLCLLSSALPFRFMSLFFFLFLIPTCLLCNLWSVTGSEKRTDLSRSAFTNDFFSFKIKAGVLRKKVMRTLNVN